MSDRPAAPGPAGWRLDGQVAVVTGGSRGLGLAIARALAEQGANVVVASRKLEACREVARTLARETDRETLAVAYHAARWEDSARLVEATWDRFGRLDVLVNNAGMSPLYPDLTSVTEDLFDKVVGVNLKGPFRLSSLVGERMAAADGGAIVNISSIAAVQPDPGELPYAVAKAGLNTLTVGLARAFAPKVRVNAIMPGPFLTDVSKAWDPDAFVRRAADSIPLRRGGDPAEIVGAALYFATRASSYTTGAVLKVDGGTAASPS